MVVKKVRRVPRSGKQGNTWIALATGITSSSGLGIVSLQTNLHSMALVKLEFKITKARKGWTSARDRLFFKAEAQKIMRMR